MLGKLKKDRAGFTLVETIVTTTILSIVVLLSLSILISTLNFQRLSNTTIEEQVNLRQAVLAVTSEVRKNPDETGALGPFSSRYSVSNEMLMRSDGSAIARGIADFSINTTDKPGWAVISIESTGGQEVSTVIYIRIY
ncbi:MAG: prepilin-type N-terminal cleavage/methylation domain-containing protein [Coriobacteriia bacterium]|nr:prepilin-type N-terminal cleavage/methylation domain-containing protein [Coriobacteriia bacterium]MCL2749661.1 prepilin-type N-terminal cleavage/methylation domain-containing protein [Coriobacteriia bacterium]